MLGNLINRHDAVRLGVFAQITGVDISPEQTGRATRHAKEAHLDDVLSFHVADARQALRGAEGQYDVVLALDSLHFGHLGETMRLIARAPGPGGLLILDDYVGPSRFQWASAQIRAANALLRQGLAAEDQALSRLGHDFTYAVCAPLAAPAPAATARARRRRRPAGPGYDVT